MLEHWRLEVKDLRGGYGRVPVLDGIELGVRAGETVAILGHNGMGKTTLMKTLVGLLPATAGSVMIDGRDVTRAPPHARARLGLGYVPQGRHIFPYLSVRENLLMGARGQGGRLDELIAEFPILSQLLERRGGILSGGEQQILALARALSGAPTVLLLDEPTEGVQPSVIEQMEEHLARLKSSRELAIVVVEQDLEFVAALADRVLIIQKGRIVRSLAPGELDDAQIVDEFVGLAGDPRPH